MSHHSTITKLRFRLLAVGLWLFVTPAAFAREAAAPDITRKLSPAEVAEIMRLVDLQPISVFPPAAYWDLQIKIGQALEANPAAARGYTTARSAAR